MRRFTHVHPSGLPLARSPRMERGPFGFFPGLRTPRSPMTHARAGTIHSTLDRITPSSNRASQSVSPLTACDISRRTVALPVTGDRPVLGLGGPFAEHDVGGDMALRGVPRPFPRFTQRATGAQAGHQLTLERAASLDVERLVDRLVADAHVDIVGEVEDQSPGDLLRTPGRGPAPIGAVRLVQPLPGRRWAGHDGPIRTLQLPAQSGLDVVL